MAGEAAEERKRTAVLVVSAWTEVGSRLLRARITGRRDVFANEETSVTVAGAETASKVVHDWLVDFEQETNGPSG